MPDISGDQLVPYRNRSAGGGLNTFAFATDIEDDQAADLTNIDASQPFLRVSRQGVSLVATGITFGPILALSGFQGVNKESELLAISPFTAYTGIGNAALWSWDGKSSLWSLVGQLTGLTALTGGIQFVVGMDLVSSTGRPYLARIFSEENLQRSWVYDGNSLLFTGAAAAAPVAGLFPAAIQQNHCFASGVGTSRGLVYFSQAAAFGLTGWNTALSVTLGGGQRQLVRSLYPFRNSDLICFMADRIDLLAITDSALDNFSPGYTGWSRAVIDTRIGCAGHLAVTSTGDDLLFIDQYGNVRSLNRTITDNQQGTKSLPVSAAIQSYIDRINMVHVRKCTAEFFDRFALFGFPLDSATEVSHVFVFDTVTRAWYGPWTGRFPAKVMTVATMSDPTAAQKFQDPSLYLGSSELSSGVVYHAFDGTTDNGDPIIYQEVTKRLTYDEIETPKFFRRLHDIWEASGADTVKVEARSDGKDWKTLTPTEDLTGDAPTIPFTFPFNFGGAGIVRTRFSLESFGETPFDLQFRFTCTGTHRVKHLGFSVFTHKKNVSWVVDS